jgi:hypothetical protein
MCKKSKKIVGGHRLDRLLCKLSRENHLAEFSTACHFFRLHASVARWYIFKLKIQMWVYFGRHCNGRCWYVYGHFVCSTAKWYIFWPFGMYFLWYIFPTFGMLYRQNLATLLHATFYKSRPPSKKL